jgi:hypothetical protein
MLDRVARLIDLSKPSESGARSKDGSKEGRKEGRKEGGKESLGIVVIAFEVNRRKNCRYERSRMLIKALIPNLFIAPSPFLAGLATRSFTVFSLCNKRPAIVVISSRSFPGSCCAQ